jgi:hypothetical protein
MDSQLEAMAKLPPTLTPSLSLREREFLPRSGHFQIVDLLTAVSNRRSFRNPFSLREKVRMRV